MQTSNRGPETKIASVLSVIPIVRPCHPERGASLTNFRSQTEACFPDEGLNCALIAHSTFTYWSEAML